MKTLKIVGLSILSIFIALYLAFLFVLPNCVDLNKYSPQITKLLQDEAGITIELEDLKIKTAWNLSAGAKVKRVDLHYLDGKKFAQIDNLRVNVSLLPLLFEKIQINKVNADKVLANVDIAKCKMQRCKEVGWAGKPNDTPHPILSPKGRGIRFSPKMPIITIKEYRISLLSGLNNYTAKGENLKISDFILNKKIRVKTNGELILNNHKQIFYNVIFFSNFFPEKQKEKVDYIKILDDLYKYNIKANITTDLKILNDSDINGKVEVDKISFVFGHKVFPASSLKLDFKGDKAKINSSLHVDKNSKVLISGIFKTGKHKAVNLQVQSDQIKINDILLIAKAMSKPFGIKHLQNIDADGDIKADFKVKSDFKKVESSGYLKIKNAIVKNQLHKIELSKINADVDFSKDSVQIKQAKANLNNQPITINGTIDKNANANILVLANNLALKNVIIASGKTEILKANEILSGLVNFKASLNGKLEKAIPQINITATNLNIKNKKTKSNIKMTLFTANSTISQTPNGAGTITDLKIYENPNSIINTPKLNLTFDNNELNIAKTYLYIANIKTELTGKISGLNSKPTINSLSVSIPNLTSTTIKGYPNSKILVKGNLTVKGDFSNPKTEGHFDVPLISIPNLSTILKNTTVKVGNDLIINCPQINTANSSADFSANIDKDLSKGIVARNVNFNSANFDLSTLVALIKKSNSISAINLTILNGKNTINNFKVARITANNITSDIQLKNNILHLDNLRADAYFGKTGGSIYYDFKKRKTYINLQGRNMSANSTLIALLGKDNDIHGQLNFDSNVTVNGFTKNELLKSLNGSTKFIITDGKMGVLGKFEHLLYAQNIISNSVFKTTLNLIAKAITTKNTGVYKYMKGKITFSDGWANIEQIKTAGPSMSLYMTGRYYMLDNTASLIILGRISDDVVQILGPIGEFSVSKAISSIPKIGQVNTLFANQITTNPNYENVSQIPPLNPKTEFKTKEFKVIIDGDVQKQSSVKSFKWLSTPKIVDANIQPPESIKPPSQSQEVPDFVNKLPDLK